MRVAYVTEAPATTIRTGGSVRRASVIDAVRAHGVGIEVVRLQRVPGSRSDLAGRWKALRRPGQVAPLLASFDLVHVEGLPPAWIATGAKELGIPSVVDLCDSWDRIRSSARTHGWREKAHVAAARLAVARMMWGPIRDAQLLTYISAEDLTWDETRFRHLPIAAVVPHFVGSELLEADLGPVPSDGSIVWLADWGYPPNAAALAWFLREVAPHLSGRVHEVTLFGSRAPSLNLPPWVRYAGYADDLLDVYRAASLVIAPIQGGAGVKTKVVEPIACGRPVITTTEGVSGIPIGLSEAAFVVDGGPQFAEAVLSVRSRHGEELEARLSRGRAAAAALSLSEVGRRWHEIYQHAVAGSSDISDGAP